MTSSYFLTLVKENFEDVSREFNLEIEQRYDYSVRLINKKCIINFTFNRGETGCTFSNPESNSEAKYHAYQVYRILYPDDKTYVESPDYNVKEELHYYHELMTNRLRPVLLGDFSWVDIMENNGQEISRKIEFIIRELPMDHPVRIKFWNGDPSWQKDVDELLSSR